MLSTVLAVLLAAGPVAGATSLVDAVRSGDRAAALQLIERHVDVNAPEPDGTTALHWAAQRNDLPLVERLIKAGANAKVRNDYGATPMSQAALIGNAAMIDALLQAGADVESPNLEGQTALMLVARAGKVDAARLLLKHGAKVDAREDWRGQTALMWATAQNHPEMMVELISHGADVNARATVNHWQRQVSGEPRALYRPPGGLTPLLFAAREGCIACARILLDAGAEIDMGDPDEIAPLELAILNAHYDLAAFLMDRGANINKWDRFGRGPVYAAVDMNTIPKGGRADGPSLDTTTSLQILERLLEEGANPNLQLKLLPAMRNVVDDRAMDRQLTIGATPLLRAAKAFDAPAIALLLKHGAHVSLPNMDGITPLMVAAGLGSTDADSRGWYTTADVQQRAIASLTLLLDAGADINRKETAGRELTALHEAARWGWNDVVKFLVARGADVHATSRGGMTPVDSALGRAGGNSRFAQRIDVFPETAALLKSYGGVEGTPVGPPAGRGAGPGRGDRGGGAGRGAGAPGGEPGGAAPSGAAASTR